MEEDVHSFVTACTICAQNSSPQSHPMALLHPLSTPSCPWSQLSMDFITSLPPSQGCRVVFVIVNHFSKAWCLVPLPKLPSALETEELLEQHVFAVFV